MKKGILAVAIAFVAVAVFGVSVFSSAASENTEIKSEIASKPQAVTVADNQKSSADSASVLEARFLNMLNHNFVYDNAFDSVEDMVNGSMPALLEYADAENDSFIAENYVADYIFSMYGIEDIDFSGINTGFEQMEGYVYIIPRGFTKYNHKITAVIANEDGSYTVESKISAASHDDVNLVNTCTTLFVPNEKSAFGFNIIYSSLGDTSTAM